MPCSCNKPVSGDQLDYANDCLNCMELRADGVLEVVVDGVTITKDGGQLCAVDSVFNGTKALVYNAQVVPWDYGSAGSALKQDCNGNFFMDAPGGWAGQISQTGSLASFQAANEDTVCVPVPCKEVCDTTDPLRLVFRGCVEVVGTWTRSKLSNAKSATVQNTVQIFDADGSVSCEVAGQECIDFRGDAQLQTVRLSNTYYIAGCVSCEAGFNIRIESIQDTISGDDLFLNDGWYRLNLETFLLRLC